VFYGVRPAVAHLWRQAKQQGRDWYYIDNAYLDAHRERCFRVTKNAVQVQGPFVLPVDHEWLSGTIKVAPWRKRGDHIVVCPQSEEYMRVVAEWPGDWLAVVTQELRRLTARPLRIRKKGETRPLAEDLKDAWALVTHTSAAAIEAAIAGVPVFVTGPCAAACISMNQGLCSFKRIEERPAGPDIRATWLEGLVRLQWSVDEIRAGAAWRAWNETTEEAAA
jgi:hypothetical protein